MNMVLIIIWKIECSDRWFFKKWTNTNTLEMGSNFEDVGRYVGFILDIQDKLTN